MSAFTKETYLYAVSTGVGKSIPTTAYQTILDSFKVGRACSSDIYSVLRTTDLCCSHEPSIFMLVHDLTSAHDFAVIRRMHKLPASLRHSFWGPPQFTARLRNIRAYVILSCMHECRVPNSEGPEMTMEECMCVVYFCKIFFHECRPTRRESGIRSLLTSNISRRTCFRTPLLIYQNASGPNFTFPKFVLGSYKWRYLALVTV